MHIHALVSFYYIGIEYVIIFLKKCCFVGLCHLCLALMSH